MSNFIDRPRYSCGLGGALATIRAFLGSGYCFGQALPNTNVIESNIIFGGEDRLREQIQNTLKIMDGVEVERGQANI